MRHEPAGPFLASNFPPAILKAESNLLIVDYGAGNLHSVEKAMSFIGTRAVVTENPEDLARADGLILPGVGAFGNGMRQLEQRGFVAPLLEYANSGKPLLGICLGMQFLFTESEEFGVHKGLNLIAGRVSYLPSRATNVGDRYRIPHMGWNRLTRPESQLDWKGTVLEGIQPGTEMYFVHSYHCEPSDKSTVTAYTRYGGNLLAAVVKKGNVCGCQFHPEKSRSAGLQLLRNFLITVDLCKSRAEA